MYEEVTRDILIRVRPAFRDEESEPDEGRYVWSYTIEIENKGQAVVQLMSREWRITDAFNQIEIVQGPGVVGEQPRIKPGEVFAYTSGAPLRTPSGFMRGAYTMRTEDGEKFDAVIPGFALDSPYNTVTLH
ncbi:Co2+/Mg2+ efflux protein ApaG [Oceanicaulis sp. UBA2681]|uniref:Co2+/Mg2+ efflux protein ApaG n=1 Tax=Oceanicaulis sp. UBA2681 TaxID=1947007 RepID=UPI000EC3F93F|nr:Co2+/Mg2+ efflux protein ApaG [Oceanicaulis sp. UBA2681]HCR65378.1 Co2+/Mg2+ efflux protein ApaG [Oceanicaulis sp.]|tara:strand:- start:24 stop:416 length:393 start_codon:yes stop_codon:yes gene_type:complete